MRFLTLLFALFAAQLYAQAAPRKVARKAPVAPLKAAPLSPRKAARASHLHSGPRRVGHRPDHAPKTFAFQRFVYARAHFQIANQPDRNFTDRDIAWSPGHQFIAYTFRKSLSSLGIEKEFGSELFLMRWDGTQKRQLTDTKYRLIADNPRFSPDGKKLLYETSSLYRGPGGGQGYTELRVRVLDLVRKNDMAIGPPETSYDPKWSRDGKRVLFTYFTRNIDFEGEGPPPVQQTMLLDGSDIQPFQNDWADYIGDNQSRDGQSRILRTPTGSSAQWEVFHIDSSASAGIIWTESNGIQPSRFVWGAKPTDKAMQAQLNQWVIEKNGRAHFSSENDIWLMAQTINTPTLLTRKAQLIDWL